MAKYIEMPDGAVVEFPDSMDDAEINAQLSQWKPEQKAPQEPQTLLDRAISAATNRIGNMGRNQTNLVNIGQIAGMANDVIGEGISAITPDIVKQGLASVAEMAPVKAATDLYGRFKQSFPEAALNIESAANIAGLMPVGKGAQVATTNVAKPVVKEAANLAGDILRQTNQKVLDDQLKKIVRNGMAVGGKPTTIGKDTASNVVQYYDRATEAVKTIVENKPNLKITDSKGNVVSKLPESLDEFSQAIEQTRKSIFNQYDSMQAQAGRAGARPDLNNLVKDLEGIANDKIILDKDKAVAKYAQEKADIFKERMANGGYSPAEAQDLIKSYNNDLLSFAKNPDYALTSKAAVDSRIVAKLRESLDVAVENATGPGYQELKNKYGALKTIEKDVNHRMGVFERSNPMGFFDQLNTFTGYEAIRGVLTGSPEVMASAFGAKAIQGFMKRKNNPNKIISSMFERAEQNIQTRNNPYRSKTMQMIGGE